MRYTALIIMLFIVANTWMFASEYMYSLNSMCQVSEKEKLYSASALDYNTKCFLVDMDWNSFNIESLNRLSVAYIGSFDSNFALGISANGINSDIYSELNSSLLLLYNISKDLDVGMKIYNSNIFIKEYRNYSEYYIDLSLKYMINENFQYSIMYSNLFNEEVMNRCLKNKIQMSIAYEIIDDYKASIDFSKYFSKQYGLLYKIKTNLNDDLDLSFSYSTWPQAFMLSSRLKLNNDYALSFELFYHNYLGFRKSGCITFY